MSSQERKLAFDTCCSCDLSEDQVDRAEQAGRIARRRMRPLNACPLPEEDAARDHGPLFRGTP